MDKKSGKWDPLDKRNRGFQRRSWKGAIEKSEQRRTSKECGMRGPRQRGGGEKRNCNSDNSRPKTSKHFDTEITMDRTLKFFALLEAFQ